MRVLSLSLLFLLFLLPSVLDETQTQQLLAEKFKADSELVTHRIETGFLADAMIVSASTLYTWKNHANFFEMARDIGKAYRRVSPEQKSEEFKRRTLLLKAEPSWIGWVDAGILALSLDQPEEAEQCFAHSLEDPSQENLSALHALRGGALLKMGRIDEAEAEHALAVSAASGDFTSIFRINYEFVHNLYDIGDVTRTLQSDGLIATCRSSAYPLEEVFALYESLMYTWAIRDETATAHHLQRLQTLLPTTEARKDSEFEQRRYDEAKSLVTRVKAALEGDEVVSMILDEESSWFDFKTQDYQAIVDRLRPWKDLYPITHYPTWDSDTRFAALSVHSAFNRATFSAGLLPDAEKGFRGVIETVSPEDNPQLVASSHCWLGLLLQNRGDWNQALENYTKALQTIPESSSYRHIYIQYNDSLIALMDLLEGGIQ